MQKHRIRPDPDLQPWIQSLEAVIGQESSFFLENVKKKHHKCKRLANSCAPTQSLTISKLRHNRKALGMIIMKLYCIPDQLAHRVVISVSSFKIEYVKKWLGYTTRGVALTLVVCFFFKNVNLEKFIYVIQN